jgi:hypothetical protein
MEHSSYFPNWALSDFCLFPKINSALKGQKFQDNRGIKKCDNGTESYSTTSYKNVSNSGSVVGLSAWLLKGSNSKVTPLSKQ